MKLSNFCLIAPIVLSIASLLLIFSVPESFFASIGVTNFNAMSALKIVPLALAVFFILLGLYNSFEKKEYAKLIILLLGTVVTGTAVMILLMWIFGPWQVWIASVAIVITGIVLGARWLYKQFSVA